MKMLFFNRRRLSKIIFVIWGNCWFLGWPRQKQFVSSYTDFLSQGEYYIFLLATVKIVSFQTQWMSRNWHGVVGWFPKEFRFPPAKCKRETISRSGSFLSQSTRVSAAWNCTSKISLWCWILSFSLIWSVWGPIEAHILWRLLFASIFFF